ncbi:MAG: sigma-70 family RNA polymerase sigma factor [Gammaproteobacteria bacterium]|nr:sigma-70 family RNA polymerase sigma factor [Gammaproteobacteria bacterium]
MESMPVYLDDKKLVKQLLAGDRRAFDRFFDDYFARLYRFAMVRLSDDPETARDVVQVTLTRAIQKLASYRAESALFTWLCAICRNEISDQLRRDASHREHVLLIEDRPDIQAAVDSFRVPVEYSPEHLYQRDQSLRLIQVALDRLPAQYGNVLEWKYVQGYSVQEIAIRLRIGAEATQSLLARAKRAFAGVYTCLQAAGGKEFNQVVGS